MKIITQKTTAILTTLFVCLSMLTTSALAFDKDKRDVEKFSVLSVNVPANVKVKQGSTQEVVLEGDDDDLANIETYVKGDKLIIKRKDSKRWFDWGSDKINIYVTMTEIEGLHISGSGTLESDGTLKTNDLDLKVSGSGDMDISCNAKNIDSSISGSGKIVLDGTSQDNEISISGSGRLLAMDLQAAKYNVTISGSGNCKINVIDELVARVSGSGNIYYKGSPDRVDSKVSGSGNIKKVN